MIHLYPAVDLRAGRCVRLYQGDFGRETVYGDDPVGQARRFAGAGAPWVHVVDLDAARTGEPVNRDVVLAVAEALADAGAQLQVGGGVRDDAAATALLDGGVHRVVVGTAALDDPDWARDLARRYPERVAVGLDARRTHAGWEVAVRGWVEGSGFDLFEAAASFAGCGVAALVVTEIGRDGTLAGPDVEGLGKVLAATDVPVVASGGVGVLDHLRALRAVSSGDRTLAGVIVGRALYEGAFTVEQALAAVR